MVRSRGALFKAIIFGEGPEQRPLEQLVREENLTGDVELCGRLPHRDVVEFMRRAAFFVMPARRADGNIFDGLPNVLIEAMACGSVVIGSRFSGIPEIIDDGTTGFLVEPEDVDALADAIERGFGDPTLCARLARNAREVVETRFDVGSFNKDYTQVAILQLME